MIASTLTDHRLIGWQKKPWLRFRPQEALSLHRASIEFLRNELAKPYEGPTVVVTHHAPHKRSIASQYSSDFVSAAYASDLEDLILEGRPVLWVHGHVHHCLDYQIGATRVVCNPHGYHDENPDFDGGFVVELR